MISPKDMRMWAKFCSPSNDLSDNNASVQKVQLGYYDFLSFFNRKQNQEKEKEKKKKEEEKETRHVYVSFVCNLC